MDLITLALSTSRGQSGAGSLATVGIGTPIPMGAEVRLSAEESALLEALPVVPAVFHCSILEFGDLVSVFSAVEGFFCGNLVVGSEILTIVLRRTEETVSGSEGAVCCWAAECLTGTLGEVEV